MFEKEFQLSLFLVPWNIIESSRWSVFNFSTCTQISLEKQPQSRQTHWDFGRLSTTWEVRLSFFLEKELALRLGFLSVSFRVPFKGWRVEETSFPEFLFRTDSIKSAFTSLITVSQLFPSSIEVASHHFVCQQSEYSPFCSDLIR